MKTRRTIAITLIVEDVTRSQAESLVNAVAKLAEITRDTINVSTRVAIALPEDEPESGARSRSPESVGGMN